MNCSWIVLATPDLLGQKDQMINTCKIRMSAYKRWQGHRTRKRTQGRVHQGKMTARREISLICKSGITEGEYKLSS